jgi:hypothetical protein
MSCETNTPLASRNSYIEFTPCGDSAASTVVLLDFTQTGTSAISGSFRLWVNGKVTAPITYSATVATLATSVASALTAAIGSGIFTAAADGTETTKVAITAAATGYHDIRAIIKSDAGVTTLTNGTLSVRYRTRGTQTYIITPDLMNFSLSRESTLEDVSPLSATSTTQMLVGTEATFELGMYYRKANALPAIFTTGLEGTLGVWLDNKVVGSPYFIASIMITSLEIPVEMKGKIEVTMSGSVQGDFIVPVGSFYNP